MFRGKELLDGKQVGAFRVQAGMQVELHGLPGDEEEPAAERPLSPREKFWDVQSHSASRSYNVLARSFGSSGQLSARSTGSLSSRPGSASPPRVWLPVGRL